jgi:hypothetical protein
LDGDFDFTIRKVLQAAEGGTLERLAQQQAEWSLFHYMHMNFQWHISDL